MEKKKKKKKIHFWKTITSTSLILSQATFMHKFYNNLHLEAQPINSQDLIVNSPL